MQNVTITLTFNTAAEAAEFLAGRGGAPADRAPEVQTVRDIDNIMVHLADPRYTLRSVDELEQKTGLDSDDIKDILDEFGIEYVIKRRRADGAALIGLAARQ